ncbi:hypothetical protein SHELI_v1c01110 [Spiroplasma helicoides]|uniref:Uncharacterized protein n=1 Tax=Spiroplasma helicoides TaxID=216938 RepID=A0A1B3SJE9_9MOLU|nr:hypothetical protein [Spiroplasma helicoides]AOG60066.1 hypothetical protein SHELI_v1c01110 [Spiroplasma helicoides]
MENNQSFNEINNTIDSVVTKNKKPKKKISFKLPEVNGVWLLFFLNIRKTFALKSGIGTGLTFLIIALIITGIGVSMSTGFSFDYSTSTIPTSMGYIFVLFFFIVFASILIISLFKVPILEGIQQIEARAGVALIKSYLVRIFTYVIVTYSYILVFLIISLIIGSSYQNQSMTFESIVISPPLFLMMFSLIWFPVMSLIALISSVAMGTFANIFLGFVVALSPLISVVMNSVSSESPEKLRQQKIVINKNAKLIFANDFYKKFANDESIKKIFEDTNILQTINNNAKVMHFKNLSLDLFDTNLVAEGKTNSRNNSGNSGKPSYDNGSSSSSSNYQPIMSAIFRGFVGGQFNLDLDTLYSDYVSTIDKLNQEVIDSSNSSEGNQKPPYNGGYPPYEDYQINKKDQQKLILNSNIELPKIETKNIFSGLEINNILQKMFDKVRESYFTDNEAPISYPNFDGGVLVGQSISSGDSSTITNLEISGMVKWLKKEFPEYKNLLDYIQWQYENYNEILFSRDKTRSSAFNSTNNLKSVFRSLPDKTNIYTLGSSSVDTNEKISSVMATYKRYPELMMINSLITQNWMSVMSYSADELFSYIGSNNLRYTEALKSYDTLEKQGVQSTIINLLNHFGLMFTGLVGSDAAKDLWYQDRDLLFSRGMTTNVSNIKQLGAYSVVNSSSELLNSRYGNGAGTSSNTEKYNIADMKNYSIHDNKVYLDLSDSLDPSTSGQELTLPMVMSDIQSLFPFSFSKGNITSLGLELKKEGQEYYLQPIDKINYWKYSPNSDSSSSSRASSSEEQSSTFKAYLSFTNKGNNDKVVEPIFKKTPLEQGLGFSVIGAAFTYLALSLAITALLFLLYRSKSRF